MFPGRWKIASLALIPVFIIFIAIFYLLNVGEDFNPSLLLMILKTVFLGLIPLYVAYIAYRSFRESGSTSVLLNGTGMLLLGTSSIAAGILGFLPNSLNITEIVQSTNFCISAILIFIGTLVALSGVPHKHGKDYTLKGSLIYECVVLYLFVFSIAAVLGLIPPFFIPGAGYTVIREFLLIHAIEFFALASLILFFLYLRKREEFHFWFSMGLAFVGLGLIAIIVSSVPGNPMSWLGRAGQYVGAVYILVAFIVLERTARKTGIPLEDMLSRFFSEPEQNFRSIVETAGEGIVLTQPDGKYTFVNQRFSDMLGYQPGELLGMSGNDLTFEDQKPEIYKARTNLANGGRSSGEFKFRRKDGSVLWSAYTSSPLYNEDGKHIANVGFLTDITDRKRAEDALKERDFRLKVAMKAASLGWHDYLPLTGEITWDRTCRALWGLGPEDHIDINVFWAGIDPASVEETKRKLEAALDPAGDGRFDAEYLVRPLDGSPNRWVHATGQTIFEGTGSGRNPAHVIGTVEDITDRKRADEELRKRTAELEQLNKNLTLANWEIKITQERLHQNVEELKQSEEQLSQALSEKEILLSEIHHRVKNNLSAFISLLSLDGSMEDTPAGKILRQDLQNRARSMALIHETLYKTQKYDTVDLRIYLETLVRQVAQSFGTSKIVISVNADGVEIDLPRATPVGLIINELVTNSFKYAFPGSFDPRTVRGSDPAITVAIKKQDGTYTLTVKDNGVGLPTGFDIANSHSLGLKLVNFLARHQLQAGIDVNTTTGTEFIFRFKE